MFTWVMFMGCILFPTCGPKVNHLTTGLACTILLLETARPSDEGRSEHPPFHPAVRPCASDYLSLCLRMIMTEIHFIWNLRMKRWVTKGKTFKIVPGLSGSIQWAFDVIYIILITALSSQLSTGGKISRWMVKVKIQCSPQIPQNPCHLALPLVTGSHRGPEVRAPRLRGFVLKIFPQWEANERLAGSTHYPPGVSCRTLEPSQLHYLCVRTLGNRTDQYPRVCRGSLYTEFTWINRKLVFLY